MKRKTALRKIAAFSLIFILGIAFMPLAGGNIAKANDLYHLKVDSQGVMTWNEIEGAASYEIDLTDNSGDTTYYFTEYDTDFALSAKCNELYTTDNYLGEPLGGGEYRMHIHIEAWDAYGETINSDDMFYDYTPKKLPGMSVTPSGAFLSWKAVPDAESYDILINECNTGGCEWTFADIAELIDEYSDELDVDGNTSWTVEIKAKDEEEIVIAYWKGTVDYTPGQMGYYPANVKLAYQTTAYTGSVKKPKVIATAKENGKTITLKEGTDYRVKYMTAAPVNVGTYTVSVSTLGKYKCSGALTYYIVKGYNNMSAKGKTVKVKYKTLKKKSLTVKKSAAFKVTGANGKVTFSRVSGPKKITVSKAGKIKIGKGLKKKTYKVKVKVKAAGDKNHEPLTRTVTVKIAVK